MEIFTSVLYYLIGWMYLWLRYRNKEKVKSVLKENYDDDYHIAGSILILRFFGAILFVLLSLFLVAVLIRGIYDLIN